MSLPEDVTPEDIAKWTLAAEADHIANPPEDFFQQIFPGYQPVDYRVRWCAGEWLARELDELGCDPDLIAQLCFAHGQRCFHSEDPWDVARAALANFRRGQWDTPGRELSMKLFAQHFPKMLVRYGPPDLAALHRIRALFDSGEITPPEDPFPGEKF